MSRGVSCVERHVLCCQITELEACRHNLEVDLEGCRAQIIHLDHTGCELRSNLECQAVRITRLEQVRLLLRLPFFSSFFSPFAPLETISTSLWASLHHHLPVPSVFSHVSYHFIFFISFSRRLRLGRPLILFPGTTVSIIFLERLSSSLLMMCPYQFNRFYLRNIDIWHTLAPSVYLVSDMVLSGLTPYPS